MSLIATPAVLYRGGTSKALVLRTEDLPKSESDAEEWLLAAYGSPDHTQIDGIGGATLVTSKFCHIAKSERPDADLDYTFIQIGIDRASVSYQILCGNISSLVAPWAIEEGYVEAVEPETTVRIYNTNINRVFTATVQVENGAPKADGDTHIDGVPGTAAPIRLDFSTAVGGRTGALLPTGTVSDTMEVDGVGTVRYSLVDIAGVQLFMNATDFGLQGTEDPATLQSKQDVLAKVEQARGQVATQLGFVSEPAKASIDSPISPFSILVSPPQDYQLSGTDTTQSADKCDFVARVMVSGTVHPAYPVTGAIPTAVAAAIEGTVVNEVCRQRTSNEVHIGHPEGIITVTADVEQDGSDVDVKQATVIRTARRIMDGHIYVNANRIPDLTTTTESPTDDPSTSDRRVHFEALAGS